MAKAYTKGLLPPPGPQGGYQDPRGRFITAQEAQAMGYGVPGLNAPMPEESAPYRFGAGIGSAVRGLGQFLSWTPHPGDIDYVPGEQMGWLGKAFNYPGQLLMRVATPTANALTNAYTEYQQGHPAAAAGQAALGTGEAVAQAALPEAARIFGPLATGTMAGAAYQAPGAYEAARQGNLAGAAGQVLGGAAIGAGMEKGGEALGEISKRTARLADRAKIRDIAANNAVARSVSAVGALQQSLLKVKGTVDGYYQTIADRMGPERIIDQTDMTKAITNDPSPQISWNEAKEARTKIGHVLYKAENAAPGTELRQKLPELRESYDSITKQLRSTAEEQGLGDVWQQANDLHKQRLRAQRLLPGNPQNPASVSFASHDVEAVQRAFNSLAKPDRSAILNALKENYGLDKDQVLKDIKDADWNHKFAKSGALSGIGIYSHPGRLLPYIGILMTTHSWPLAIGSALGMPEVARWYRAAGEEPLPIRGGAFGLNAPAEIPPAPEAPATVPETPRTLPPINIPVHTEATEPTVRTMPEIQAALDELSREGKLSAPYVEDLQKAIDKARAQSGKTRTKFRTAEAVAEAKRRLKK